MKKPTLTVITLTALLAGWVPNVLADDLADKGRDLFKQQRQTVVTVQVVSKTKMSFGGVGERANESKTDVTGTVVDPSGLTVLALSSCEPANMVQDIMSGMSEADMKFKLDTELGDIKILLEDGTETPADVVLRDRDLDLAFIRPKAKPAAPMAALDLTKSAPAQILDQVFTLNRLGKAAGRAHSVSIERISAVVQKPRLFYIPDSAATMSAMGCPAFTTDGKVVGILVMRSVSSKGSGGFGLGMFSGQLDGLTPIILPAEDVLKAAKQAPEVKETPEAKPEKK